MGVKVRIKGIKYMGSERASDVRLKSEEVRIWGVEVRTLKGVEGLMDYKLVHEY